MDAIVHTASPFSFNPKEPEGAQRFHSDTQFMYSTFYEIELINPAVQGTLGMLKSALKNEYASLPEYTCIYIDCFLKISGATYCYNILLRSGHVTTSIQAYRI